MAALGATASRVAPWAARNKGVRARRRACPRGFGFFLGPTRPARTRPARLGPKPPLRAREGGWSCARGPSGGRSTGHGPRAGGPFPVPGPPGGGSDGPTGRPGSRTVRSGTARPAAHRPARPGAPRSFAGWDLSLQPRGAGAPGLEPAHGPQATSLIPAGGLPGSSTRARAHSTASQYRADTAWAWSSARMRLERESDTSSQLPRS